MFHSFFRRFWKIPGLHFLGITLSNDFHVWFIWLFGSRRFRQKHRVMAGPWHRCPVAAVRSFRMWRTAGKVSVWAFSCWIAPRPLRTGPSGPSDRVEPSFFFVGGVESENKYLENSWGINSCSATSTTTCKSASSAKRDCRVSFFGCSSDSGDFPTRKKWNPFRCLEDCRSQCCDDPHCEVWQWGNTRENSGEKLGKCSTGASWRVVKDGDRTDTSLDIQYYMYECVYIYIYLCVIMKTIIHLWPIFPPHLFGKCWLALVDDWGCFPPLVIGPHPRKFLDFSYPWAHGTRTSPKSPHLSDRCGARPWLGMSERTLRRFPGARGAAHLPRHSVRDDWAGERALVS